MSEAAYKWIPGPEDTTVRWFGDLRPVGYDERTRIPRPVGQECLPCKQPIGPDDNGYAIPEMSTGKYNPQHHWCFMEMLLGPRWRELLRNGETHE